MMSGTEAHKVIGLVTHTDESVPSAAHVSSFDYFSVSLRYRNCRSIISDDLCVCVTCGAYTEVFYTPPPTPHPPFLVPACGFDEELYGKS